MATNRSQIYIDTVDNSSDVIKRLGAEIDKMGDLLTSLGPKSDKGIGSIGAAAQKAQSGMKATATNIDTAGAGLVRLAARALPVVAAFLSIRKAGEEIADFFKEGIKFNIETDQAKIGIAGVLASVYQIEKEGKKLDGMEKFTQAINLSDEAMKRLRISAITTGANVKELVEGFQQAVGPAAQLGFTIQQTEKISSLVANASKAMGQGKNQVGQELKALLTGDIDANAQIGSALGLKGSKEFKEILKKGGKEAFDYLDSRLAQFANAGKAQAASLGGIFDEMKEGWEMFRGEASKAFGDTLTQLKPQIDRLFTITPNTADFSEKLDGLKASISVVGELIATKLVQGATDFLDLVLQVSTELEKNQTPLNLTIGLLEQIGGLFKDMIVATGEVVKGVGSIFGGLGDVFGISDDVNGKLNDMETALKIVVAFVGALRVGFGFVKDVVIGLVDLIRAGLGGGVQTIGNSLSGMVNSVSKGLGAIGFDGLAAKAAAAGKSIEGSFDKATKKVVGDKNVIVGGMNGQNGLFENTSNAALDAAEKLSQAAQKSNKSVKDVLNGYKVLRDNKGANAFYGISGDNNGLKVSGTPKSKDDGKSKKAKADTSDTTNELLKGYEKELEAFKKGNNFKRKENELLYDNFKKNITDYYLEKERLDKADYDKQQLTYNKELEIAKAAVGTQKTRKEEEALQVKILEIQNKKSNAEKEFNLATMETAINREKDFRKMNDQLKEFKANIADLLGNTKQNQTIKLDVEIDGLKRSNAQNPEMLKEIEKYDTIKRFKIGQQQENTLLDLSEEKLNITRENGYLSQVSYFQQLGTLNKARLAQLEAELTLIKSLAPSDQDNVRIKEIENAILRTKSQLDPLAADIEKTFKNSFGTFFSDILTGTKSAKDAFKDLTSSISQYFMKLAAEKLTQQLFDGLSSLGGGSGGGKSGGGGWLSSAAGLLAKGFGGGMATGGNVQANMAYNVGENGKEIFIPRQNGYMMNARQTREWERNNGGGGTNVFNVNVSTPNYSSFQNSENQIAGTFGELIQRAQTRR